MSSYEDSYDVPSAQIIAERLRGLSRSVGDLLKWRREVDKDRAEFALQIHDLAEDVKVVKRLLIGLLVTAVTGSVSITIAIILSTRGKG